MSRAEIMRMLHRQVAQDERGAGTVGGTMGGRIIGGRPPRLARGRAPRTRISAAHAPAVSGSGPIGGTLGGAKAQRGLAAYHAWKATQPAGMTRDALKMAWRMHKSGSGLVGGAYGSQMGCGLVGGFAGQKEAAAAITAHLRNMKSEANMRTYNELAAYKALKAEHPLKKFNKKGTTDAELHEALRLLQVPPEIIARTHVGRAPRQPRAAAAPKARSARAARAAPFETLVAQQRREKNEELARESAAINELLAEME